MDNNNNNNKGSNTLKKKLTQDRQKPASHLEVVLCLILFLPCILYISLMVI
ncbi:hypothetical protein RhiirC2_735024, partial [Rhizophagus irregularis]